MCKFGSDPTICVGEEAICTKVYGRTDRQTDDGRRAIALAHSWNELKKPAPVPISYVNQSQCVNHYTSWPSGRHLGSIDVGFLGLSCAKIENMAN